MKKLFQLLRNLLIFLAGFIGLDFAIDFYYKTPIQEYRESASDYSSKSDAEDVAKEKGFFIFPLKNNPETLIVLNHRSFVFRYQCSINYSGLHYNSHQFMAAD